MAQNSLADANIVAASNTDFGGVGVLGSSNLSTADNAFRELYAQLGRFNNDLAGSGQTVGGTSSALTVQVNQAWAALAGNLAFIFENTVGANAGAVTLAVSNNALTSLGTKALRRQGDSALVGGEMVLNGYYLVTYNASYNSGAGAWVLLNPAGVTSSAFSDSAFRVQDNGDATKQLAFEVSGITTGTTRTVTQPDASGVMVLEGAGQTTIASATSTAIGASKTQEIIISGTTTITSFDTVAAGTVREGYFSGALTLTHSGTALILPGAANITTAANDRFRFLSLGSGNWICVSYIKADGTPVVAPASGGETLLATLTTTSGTAQNATGLSTTYNMFRIEQAGVNFSVADQLQLNISSDGGSTFDTAQPIWFNTTAPGATVGWLGAVGLTSGKPYIGSGNVNSPNTGVSAQFLVKTGPTNYLRFSGVSAHTFNAGVIRIYGVK